MAERRIFSKRITTMARFIKMPLTTQALYFHLGINADDDGVVEAFPVMRMTGATEDDLRILISKQYVIPLNEDLVCYIADWSENNKIRSDRKVDSIYQSLLIKVVPDVELIKKTQRADLKKTQKSTQDVQWTSSGQPKDGIGKDSIGKDSIEKESIYSDKSSYISSSFPTPIDSGEEKQEQTNDNSPTFIEFPLLGGTTAPISEDWCDEKQAVYGQGGVNVRFEIQQAKEWCLSNQLKKDWKKFLNNWFMRCVSSGGSKVKYEGYTKPKNQGDEKEQERLSKVRYEKELDELKERFRREREEEEELARLEKQFKED